ncbi:hypothetical protein N5853_10705 [Bartonella sp. HY329]|uniref:hypothetical protein n=1 Tax=unclassified Bartonella TaxID=2645622 RepID=UPI0021C97533|nr:MULTISPECIES: hypothetical protein [unclassified Bartonella]UXM94567.1 hypothetical protein N5853_10705 [Bartonella sp. HY329]UXN08891.1 hypothetical protein N5852_10715 [Bartonella sp. HY328]
MSAIINAKAVELIFFIQDPNANKTVHHQHVHSLDENIKHGFRQAKRFILLTLAALVVLPILFFIIFSVGENISPTPPRPQAPAFKIKTEKYALKDAENRVLTGNAEHKNVYVTTMIMSYSRYSGIKNIEQIPDVLVVLVDDVITGERLSRQDIILSYRAERIYFEKYFNGGARVLVGNTGLYTWDKEQLKFNPVSMQTFEKLPQLQVGVAKIEIGHSNYYDEEMRVTANDGEEYYVYLSYDLALTFDQRMNAIDRGVFIDKSSDFIEFESFPNGKKRDIACLDLAYKPGTPYDNFAFGLELEQVLANKETVTRLNYSVFAVQKYIKRIDRFVSDRNLFGLAILGRDSERLYISFRSKPLDSEMVMYQALDINTGEILWTKRPEEIFTVVKDWPEGSGSYNFKSDVYDGGISITH